MTTWFRATVDAVPRYADVPLVVHHACLVPGHGTVAACGLRLRRGGAPVESAVTCMTCLRRLPAPLVGSSG